MHASFPPMLLLSQKMRVASFPRRRTTRKRYLLKYAKATIVATIVLLAICRMYACGASSMVTRQLTVNVEYFG